MMQEKLNIKRTKGTAQAVPFNILIQELSEVPYILIQELSEVPYNEAQQACAAQTY